MLNAIEYRELDARFAEAPTEQILSWAWDRFGSRAAIGTSFQGAGLVMIHLALERGLRFPLFTLDTDLLFAETYELKRNLEAFFGVPIEAIHPEVSLEQQEEAMGAELWKHQPDLCCTVRKVLPLQSKLATLDCWITGLRRQQSETRKGIGVIEVYVFDEAQGKDIVKLNPMARWTRDEVWAYIQRHGIPYNPLQDQGYRSIGCRPCTARGGANGNERAGRWIGFNKVECGIHTFMSRKVDFQI